MTKLLHGHISNTELTISFPTTIKMWLNCETELRRSCAELRIVNAEWLGSLL